MPRPCRALFTASSSLLTQCYSWFLKGAKTIFFGSVWRLAGGLPFLPLLFSPLLSPLLHVFAPVSPILGDPGAVSWGRKKWRDKSSSRHFARPQLTAPWSPRMLLHRSFAWKGNDCFAGWVGWVWVRLL